MSNHDAYADPDGRLAYHYRNHIDMGHNPIILDHSFESEADEWIINNMQGWVRKRPGTTYSIPVFGGADTTFTGPSIYLFKDEEDATLFRLKFA